MFPIFYYFRIHLLFCVVIIIKQHLIFTHNNKYKHLEV